MSEPSIDPQLEVSWKQELAAEFQSAYFRALKTFLKEEMQQFQIFPPGKKIFAAFDSTPFSSVKVVVIGQDPYHGAGQANGLWFSVSDGIAPPPSLVNIFKELNNDLGISIPTTGNLEPWAKQGVLLLNATLTVRANQAGSHQNRGWEQFTDAVIKIISQKKEGVVFLLWGKFAISKTGLIDHAKHHVLTAPHPSPLSAHKGFLGCKHFSKTNEILNATGKSPINWSLSG